MDEELFLKQRLALDDRAVKGLEKKVFTFLHTLGTESVESAQHSFENILIQLLSYRTNLERNPIIEHVNAKDINEYNAIVERTAVAQREAMKDIVSLKQDLLAAQKIRNHKLEYDRVAREIMKLDTRDSYTESITQLKKEIEVLQREKINKLIALENRKKNLSQAVQNLKDLQRSVEEERAMMNDDKRMVMDMERGYASSDEEGDILSEDEQVKPEQDDKKYTSHRFHERKSEDEDEDEEEGIVLDTPMAE
ncbi:hypothetical protein RMCBS344292_06974 [Rhizopus microsporus]|nr:hypothetical protein RMCBS344292_06974 [Rhizopus microsporus]